MTHTSKYRTQRVNREVRSDGTVLLSSQYTLGPVVQSTGEWLRQWAAAAPERVFIAERSGAGWREETYSATFDLVRSVGAALLARGLNGGTPIMIMSGNGVDHALLALAGQFVGIPIVPIAEQYALIPGARDRLRHAIELVRPGMVYVSDADTYRDAIVLDDLARTEIVASSSVGHGMTSFCELLRGDNSADVDAAHGTVGPDTIAKILLTSGSTANPKGVLTTHRMMCANQTQLRDALPFLTERAPRIVDWLPWNHVFGGSHNFNMMLANGGSLYIDDGKPAGDQFGRTIENLTMVVGTLAFNVPVGFTMLVNAMRDDRRLKQRFFADLDLIFYAGASLPQDVWEALATMANEVKGDIPLMTSSWGLTETAPSLVLQSQPAERSGIVGAPLTGVTVKLVPLADNRYEARVKGPNIMPGYFRAPDETARSFDEDGYLITGDAMAFVDADDADKGLRFDGRISEDFKLLTGTWVRAAVLRLEMLSCLAPLAADVVIAGHDRGEIGVLIFANRHAVLDLGQEPEVHAGALMSEALRQAIAHRLRVRSQGARGSSVRIGRALVLAEPPSIADGEMTAKGNLNFRKVLDRRATMLERLYDDTDPATIRI